MAQRKITEIIVHCAATPEGKDFTVDDITRWHKQRGFRTIGYHHVVYRDGSVHPGRPEGEIGAHCTGPTAGAMGVCDGGGGAADGEPAPATRPPDQRKALLMLLRRLRAKYPNAKIHGHRDFAAKACPSFDATKEYADL